MTNELQPEDLADQVVNLVQQFWKDHNRPLLLSQLGAHDNGQIAKRAKEEAGSLGMYLRNRLSDRIRVLQHSTKPTIIGAIPANEDIPGEDSDGLLNQTQTQSESVAQRFRPAFWAAFRKPLDHSLRRYISIQPPIHFRDVNLEPQSSGFIEIEQDFIVDTDADDTIVQQKINNWLADKKVDAIVFASDTKRQTACLPADDLLGRLLLALEPEELKRMSIPLDIVKKLRGQSL